MEKNREIRDVKAVPSILRMFLNGGMARSAAILVQSCGECDAIEVSEDWKTSVVESPIEDFKGNNECFIFVNAIRHWLAIHLFEKPGKCASPGRHRIELVQRGRTMPRIFSQTLSAFNPSSNQATQKISQPI